MVHLNMLSAVTKELKESEQLVQDKRKRPYQSKLHTEVIELEWPKTRTKYPLRGRLESQSEEGSGDQKSRMEPSDLPDNPFDGQLCQLEKKIHAEKKPDLDTGHVELCLKILAEQKFPPSIAVQPLISSRTQSRSREAKEDTGSAPNPKTLQRSAPNPETLQVGPDPKQMRCMLVEAAWGALHSLALQVLRRPEVQRGSEGWNKAAIRL